MYRKHRGIHEQLISISRSIDHFIVNRESYAVLLDEIENWLKAQLERLKMQKLKDSKAIIRQGNRVWREDAIFIFDSSLKIIHYCGPQNYFTGSSAGRASEFTLLDFIDDNEHQKFNEAFTNAKGLNENLDLVLHIKTGTYMLKKCTMSVDMSPAGIQSNRFIACVKLFTDLEYQLSEYQSILFDNLPGMDIFLFDRDYRYIVSGGKEKERFQLTNEDLIGKTMFEVYDKKTLRSIFPFYNKAINGESTEGEVRFRNQIYYLMAMPVKDIENNTIAAILISQNVTNDKLVEEQLKKAKEDAQKADRAKSIFIANMSHEIRTPLSAIIGFSEQLEKTELTTQQIRYLSLIKKASDHLLYLVTEVVFLFKLGMGKVYIEKRPFSLDELISELNDLFTTQASEKKLKFKVHKDSALPQILVGDPFRLRQILMNLLVNAIKYTDTGTVKLVCLFLRENKRKVKLSFQVTDTGVGISEKDLSNIFNVFEQGEKLTASVRGGAGLGLGICHRLVKLLGGEISVTSKLHKGSVFTVVLSFEKTDEPIIAKDEKKFNVDGEYLAGKKILLADDDEHNMILAGLILRKWKTDYVLVKNGRDALEHLEKTKFDTILLDIHMGELNGVDVIRATRSGKGLNRTTPAISVTANAIKADLHRYLKAGFNDYLVKPYREAELYNKLCNILALEPITDHQTTSLNVQGNPTGDVLNTGELEHTAKGDQEFINMMIGNFINNSKILKNVLEISLQSGNWEEVGERVHKAIPSFKYFGLLQIASKLELIEDLALRRRDFSDLPSLMQETIGQINRAVSHAAALKGVS